MKEKKKIIDAQERRKLPKLALDAIALAMGVTSIVWSVLGRLQASIGLFVGLGISALGLAGSNSIEI